jgi:hypothetical protein
MSTDSISPLRQRMTEEILERYAKKKAQSEKQTQTFK